MERHNHRIEMTRTGGGKHPEGADQGTAEWDVEFVGEANGEPVTMRMPRKVWQRLGGPQEVVLRVKHVREA